MAKGRAEKGIQEMDEHGKSAGSAPEEGTASRAGEPAISVITPVYNVTPWLDRFVESILAQTENSWELLLVEDGSSDGSGALCDEWAKRDSRIRAFHELHKGVSAARNRGIEEAAGRCVMFLDADDWADPELLQRLYGLMEEQEVDLVCCDVFNVTENADGISRLDRTDKWQGQGDRRLGRSELYPVLFRYSATLWNKLFRREVLAGEDFDEGLSYGEDAEYLSRVLGHAKSAWITSYTGYYYVKNRSGNTVSAPLSERDLQLFESGGAVFDRLAREGEAALAVWRNFVVINQVLNKTQTLPLSAPLVRKACSGARRLARRARLKVLAVFLRADYCTKAQKRRYLLWRVSPALVLWKNRGK